MKTIPLTKGYFTKVDDEDYKKLASLRWYASIGVDGNVRARRTGWINKKMVHVFMSRTILNAPQGKYVDHINGDPLDNRKCNLRLCSPLENSHNAKISKDNKYGYKGIVLTKYKRWGARIYPNKKIKWLGTYNTKEEAALAYNEAAKKYFGGFAKLNIIK
jgi:hypothetical protein